MDNVRPQLRAGYVGTAGEYRVASELTLRGHKVFTSELDHGVDMVLDNGKKIQVKAAYLNRNTANHSNSYRFAVRHWGENRRGTALYHVQEMCDFWILWCIEANAFYIIPAQDIVAKFGVNLYPASIGSSADGKTKYTRNRSIYNKYLERWDLLV